MDGRRDRSGARLPNPLRIAYFSPLPPQRSGIADYSRELLPYLAEHAELTLYTADPEQVDAQIRTQFAVRELGHFAQERRQFDLPLYQMGNSEYHESFYPTLLRYPGLVVLHDYLIHQFIAYRSLEQGDFTGYGREMGYALGAQGMQLAHAIRLGQAPPASFDIPLNERLLDSSLGLIVHSTYAADKVRAAGFERPLAIIPALIAEHPGQSRRASLGIDPTAPLFASYGVITRQKQIELALTAFRDLRDTVPEAHYLLVGEALSEVDPQAIIARLDLAGSVTHIGYVPDLEDFVDWIHTADIVINLRDPTVGETSATALRAMAAGRPLIVFDHGWYHEIPDEAALKIAPRDQPALLAAMLRLAQSPALRQALGDAGQRYTRAFCHPAAVASAYQQAISATLERILEAL